VQVYIISCNSIKKRSNSQAPRRCSYWQLFNT